MKQAEPFGTRGNLVYAVHGGRDDASTLGLAKMGGKPFGPLGCVRVARNAGGMEQNRDPLGEI